MKSVITALLIVFVIVCSAFAQAEPAQPFPDQFVSAGATFDQASTPQLSGFVAYAKLTSRDNGLYSYTKISETSINLKPSINIQTQTETGFCIYTLRFGQFDVFACGTGGISTAGGSTGPSGSGTLLITKALAKGFTIGLAAGPSYSGVASKISYPIGLVFGWGK